MTHQDYEKLYSEIFPFWETLNDNDKEAFCRYTTEIKYKKDENIHGGDGKCTGAIIVKSGSIRTYILSEEGKEITLFRLYPGDICMLTASCVLQSITFDVFVSSEEDSTCQILSGKMFSEISKRNMYVKNFALETALQKFSDVMWIVQQILFMSYDKRLAIFLLDEISKTGSDNVKLTHEQIAKYTGSAREVVSRMLKYFDSEGITEHSRAGIKIIDKKKLRGLTL